MMKMQPSPKYASIHHFIRDSRLPESVAVVHVQLYDLQGSAFHSGLGAEMLIQLILN